MWHTVSGTVWLSPSRAPITPSQPSSSSHSLSFFLSFLFPLFFLLSAFEFTVTANFCLSFPLPLFFFFFPCFHFLHCRKKDYNFTFLS